jgi:hypothetical protein
MNEYMTEYATEGFGWKVFLSGIGTGATGWLVELDWVTIIGITVVAGGFVLQLLEHLRKRAESRALKLLQEEEQLQRSQRHALEMAILRERLTDLQTDTAKGST